MLKPIREKVAPDIGSCLTIRRYRGTRVVYLRHEHAEYELVYFVRSQGKRFVGDHVGRYDDGELALVGPRLPHTWEGDPSLCPDSETDLVVIHFSDEPLGSFLRTAVEFKRVASLLEESKQGLLFPALKTLDWDFITAGILSLENLSETDRLMGFLEILRRLSVAKRTSLTTMMVRQGDTRSDDSPASSPQGYRQDHGGPTVCKDSSRIDQVFAYVAENYAEPLTVGGIADHFGMSKQAFCRFFRRSTARTFIGYLNQVRIGRASTLLIDTEQTISEVCYQVGYNNISHFNQTFRKLKGMNPGDFRKLHDQRKDS